MVSSLESSRGEGARKSDKEKQKEEEKKEEEALRRKEQRARGPEDSGNRVQVLLALPVCLIKLSLCSQSLTRLDTKPMSTQLIASFFSFSCSILIFGFLFFFFSFFFS